MPDVDATRHPVQLDFRSRVANPRSWIFGGMVTKSLQRRNYDVQPRTGFSSSTVPAGQWDRGILIRDDTPALALPPEAIMFDPTDPMTWDSPRVKGRRSRG